MSTKRKPMPALLDIVKIDGRWTQVVGASNDDYSFSFLGEDRLERVLLRHYRLVTSYNSITLQGTLASGKMDITPEEIKRVRWGPEQEALPYLKRQVRVFGEYVRKNEK